MNIKFGNIEVVNIDKTKNHIAIIMHFDATFGEMQFTDKQSLLDIASKITCRYLIAEGFITDIEASAPWSTGIGCILHKN